MNCSRNEMILIYVYRIHLLKWMINTSCFYYYYLKSYVSCGFVNNSKSSSGFEIYLSCRYLNEVIFGWYEKVHCPFVTILQSI